MQSCTHINKTIYQAVRLKKIYIYAKKISLLVFTLIHLAIRIRPNAWIGHLLMLFSPLFSYKNRLIYFSRNLIFLILNIKK